MKLLLHYTRRQANAFYRLPMCCHCTTRDGKPLRFVDYPCVTALHETASQCVLSTTHVLSLHYTRRQANAFYRLPMCCHCTTPDGKPLRFVDYPCVTALHQTASQCVLSTTHVLPLHYTRRQANAFYRLPMCCHCTTPDGKPMRFIDYPCVVTALHQTASQCVLSTTHVLPLHYTRRQANAFYRLPMCCHCTTPDGKPMRFIVYPCLATALHQTASQCVLSTTHVLPLHYTRRQANAFYRLPMCCHCTTRDSKPVRFIDYPCVATALHETASQCVLSTTHVLPLHYTRRQANAFYRLPMCCHCTTPDGKPMRFIDYPCVATALHETASQCVLSTTHVLPLHYTRQQASAFYRLPMCCHCTTRDSKPVRFIDYPCVTALTFQYTVVATSSCRHAG